MREYFKKLKSPFHIYNRGTEKRIIFTNYAEYCRFVFLMWVCRIGSPAVNLSRKDIIKAAEAILAGEEPNSNLYIKESHPLIAFVTWNILPNHFHFILVSLVDGGITKYMSKLGNAYTKYFNARHQRNGRLFQGSYQSIEIKDPRYLYTLIKYINLNHVELIEPLWKEGEIRNQAKVKKFTNTYQWSTHQDFLGIRKSLLISKETVSNLLEGKFTEEGGLNGYSDLLDQPFIEDFKLIENYLLE